jgi:hypothetical protein
VRSIAVPTYGLDCGLLYKETRLNDFLRDLLRTCKKSLLENGTG